jgi:hypothetical protein
MILEEAKELAQQGVKMTHNYFTDEEYITMRGNIIVFEDGCKIFFNEWVQGKEYLKTGWSRFEEIKNLSN